MRYFLFVFLFIAFISQARCSVKAIGWIKDIDSEKGVSGLEVRLVPQDKGISKELVTETDAEGLYEFGEILVSKYLIYISSGGSRVAESVIEKKELERVSQFQKDIYIVD